MEYIVGSIIFLLVLALGTIIIVKGGEAIVRFFDPTKKDK